MAWRLRADAPETTEWQDIFDRKIYGQTALDVYEEVKGLEAQAEDLARKTRRRRAVVQAYEAREGRSRSASRGASGGSESARSASGESALSGESSLSSDDAEFFAQYKERRRKELAAQRGQPVYGELREIRAQEYTRETHSPGSVVILMYAHASRECARIRILLQRLAARFVRCKFVSIEANECIDGYPESLCPTLLVYKDGKKASQFVGTAALGGASVDEKWLERVLAKAGAFQTPLTEEDDGEPVDAAQRLRGML